MINVRPFNSIYMVGPDHNMATNVRLMREAGYHELVMGGGEDTELPWFAMAKVELQAMLNCDAIHLPVGFENDRLARLMRHLAIDLGMKVIYGREQHEYQD